MAILALGLAGLAGGAEAQVNDPATIGQQNQLFTEYQALRQQTLDQARQAFVQEQRAQTDRALSDLAAARRGEPPAISMPAPPPLSATLSARADTIGRLADEAVARSTVLTVRPGAARQP